MEKLKLFSFIVISIIGTNSFIFGQNIDLAKNYNLAERYDDARDALEQTIKNEPNNPVAYYFLGETVILEYLNDSLSNSLEDVCQEANAAFEAGLSKDSLNKLNYVGKGMLEQLCNDDTVAADKYFNKAISSFPKNPKKYTKDHALLYEKIALAETLGKNKRYANAINHLNSAKKIAPDNFEIYITIGNIYMEQVDGTNAILNYNDALSFNSESPLPLLKIGYLYLRAKNFNLARSYFDQAKDIDSTYAPIYKSYGELWNIAGRYDLAKESFRTYLALSGNNIPAKISYVSSLYKTRDYEEAINVIDEIKSVDNSRNYLNRVAGYSCYDKKPADYEKANNYLTEFFQNARPSNITAKDYLYYGRTLIRLNKDSLMIVKGIQMLNKSAEMTPDNHDLLFEIAQTYFTFNYYEDCAKTLENKIQQSKATQADYFLLGRAYMQIKDYGKAAETYDKVIADEPGNMDALMRSAAAYGITDPGSKKGSAKPRYEQIIKLGMTDQGKYAKELCEAYMYMGSFYLFSGDADLRGQCQNYFLKIINLDPNNKEWLKTAYSSLAIYFTKEQEFAKARNWYYKLLEVDPGNETAKSAIDSITKKLNMDKVMSE